MEEVVTRMASSEGSETNKRTVAEWILFTQVMLVVAGIVALGIREIPGGIREWRMWKIASFSSGKGSSSPRKS